MSHRHRAQARLERHVPQLRDRAGQAPWARMMERADESEEERPVLGASLRVRGEEGVKKTVLRTVEAGPNAPLLMRIVRHPFALATVRYGKIRHREDAAERVRLEPSERPLAYRAELREAYSAANPVLVHAHRPEHRPRPFLRARLAAEEPDE